jgi:hypothetical protein
VNGPEESKLRQSKEEHDDGHCKAKEGSSIRERHDGDKATDEDD